MFEHQIALPDRVYQRLLAAAHASGVTPADWIANHLPQTVEVAEEFDPATVEHLLGGFDSRKHLRPVSPPTVFEEAIIEKMTEQGLRLP
ncbi:hypothetical protein Sta7437_1845 [Stanieria cyanosphaera PCC 7437]|uniref:Uncharacterized protein n=1 Tax=Stanieria cyanosphaera (strain ATCC 29371 / PCC 7437) TaxID=111780 RepID=K9XTJ4_STAC7|nr:hypothetical protein [Stanieria cyanosphaera]AFZ35401.1 hypothetical protein Sta7437_1845 [Stanieria cyanosphaera PCC 7437]